MERLSGGTWSIAHTDKPAEAFDHIQRESPDCVLFDLALRGCYVPELLCQVSNLLVDSPLCVLTREYSFSFVTFARDAGVAGYFRIPCDYDRIFSRINALLEAVKPDIHSVCEALPSWDSAEGTKTLVGKSPAITRIREKLISWRNSLAPVLIQGESGTGKDVAAHVVHYLSSFSRGPFITYNASCLASGFAESILFGTLPSSYTAAVDTPGLFEQAHEGTLFLDEIGDLDYSLQAKFLRVIEDGVICRLGTNCRRTVRFRLICATNQDVASCVRAGRFRSDLFYRLDENRLTMPPLRDHLEDIPLLASLCLRSLNKQLTDGALQKLMNYSWPGNVRELFTCLRRSPQDGNSPFILPESIVF